MGIWEPPFHQPFNRQTREWAAGSTVVLVIGGDG